jgi:hypothetical protein
MNRLPVYIALWLLLSGRDVAACPTCNQSTREAVNAAIFNEAFGHNLAVAAAPFFVFGAISAWLYFGDRERGRH